VTDHECDCWNSRQEVLAMMFWYGGHWVFWQASLMWLGMILFWGLLAWAIYALVTARTPRRPHGDHEGGDAQRILDQRLARGDIDEAEYRRLRDLIGPGGKHEPTGTRTAR
jgi:putative membrane protein